MHEEKFTIEPEIPTDPYEQMEMLCRLCGKNRMRIVRDTLLNLFIIGAWINAKVRDPVPRQIDMIPASALSLGIRDQYETHKKQKETRRLIGALFNRMPTTQMETILKKHWIKKPRITFMQPQTTELLKPQS